jgi:hypothetical protein
MGTEIRLDIGGVNLTYSKNHIGIDHGSLFQEKDRKRCKSDQINYEYFEENNEEPADMEMAFVRQLGEITPRLELLGFTLDYAKHEYKKLVAEFLEERATIEEELPKEHPDCMTFEEFTQFATEHQVATLDDTFILGVDKEREVKVCGRFHKDSRTERIPFSYDYDSDGYSEANYFGNLIGVLHPYSILRILSENKDNLDLDVVWQYGPLVDAGWAKQEEFTSGAKRREKFLIATEGVSDTRILKHALSILKPQVEDFFTFVDIEEGHPFSGVGNLVNFARGLIKIDVQNKVVFLFDNDAVGYESYGKLINMQPPCNIRGIMLPELDQFRSFRTKGPEGCTHSNINRRAAAIECYLDLKSGSEEEPLVTWKNYIKSMDMYHGSLNHKAQYEKEFLKQDINSIVNGTYDTEKIKAVLETMLSECRNIAAELRTNEMGCFE